MFIEVKNLKFIKFFSLHYMTIYEKITNTLHNIAIYNFAIKTLKIYRLSNL